MKRKRMTPRIARGLPARRTADRPATGEPDAYDPFHTFTEWNSAADRKAWASLGDGVPANPPFQPFRRRPRPTS